MNLNKLLFILSFIFMISTLISLHILRIGGYQGAYWFTLSCAATGWANYLTTILVSNENSH